MRKPLVLQTLILIMLLGFAGFAAVQPVQAQTIVCHQKGHSDGDISGVTILSSSGVTGTWNAADHRWEGVAPDSTNRILIRYDTSGFSSITSIAMNYSRRGFSASRYNYIADDTGVNLTNTSLNLYYDAFFGSSLPLDTPKFVGVDASKLPITSDYIDFFVSVADDGVTPEYNTRIYDIQVCGYEGGGGPDPDQWFRPFAESVEHGDWGVYSIASTNHNDEVNDLQSILLSGITTNTLTGQTTTLSMPDDDNAVHAYSSVPDAQVLSAINGEVVAVRRTYRDCSVTNWHLCRVFIPSDVLYNPILEIIEEAWVLNLAPSARLFHVMIRVDTDLYLHYTVANADEYVNVGDVIEQGCILGESIPLETVLDLDISLSAGVTIDGPSVGASFTVTTNPAYRGWVRMQLSSDDAGSNTLVLIDKLNQYGIPGAACNVQPEYAACKNGDPEFAGTGYWSATNGALIDNGYGGLPPDGILYTTTPLNLDNATQYTIAISYDVGAGFLSPGPGELVQLQITLGDTTQVYSLDTSTTVFTSPAQTYSPDNSGFYNFEIKNNSDIILALDSVCISDNAQPFFSPCIFSNNSFDDDLTNWSPTGDVSAERPGEIIMGDADAISQNVVLTPDNAVSGSYTLVVNLAKSTDFDPVSASVSIDIDYPFDSGNPTYDVVPLTTDQLTSLDDGEIVEVTHSIPVATTLDGIFSIRTTMNITDIRIQSVCLVNASTPPGDRAYSCDVVSQPIGDTFGDWISWHWSQLQRFFDCDLMVILVQIEDALLDIFELIGWSVRYFINTIVYSFDWVESDLLPWIAGYLDNISIGRNTVLITDSGSANGWDAIIAIFENFFGGLFEATEALLPPVIDKLLEIVDLLVNTVVSAFLALLTALIEIGVQFIEEIFRLFDMALGFLGIVINAWNTADPIVPDGLPNCSVNPQGNAFCIVIWGLEHTILSGTGALFIPILIGLGSIKLIIWVVAQLKQTLYEAGRGV